jgi:hypothetical protein
MVDYTGAWIIRTIMEPPGRRYYLHYIMYFPLLYLVTKSACLLLIT